MMSFQETEKLKKRLQIISDDVRNIPLGAFPSTTMLDTSVFADALLHIINELEKLSVLAQRDEEPKQ